MKLTTWKNGAGGLDTMPREHRESQAWRISSQPAPPTWQVSVQPGLYLKNGSVNKKCLGLENFVAKSAYSCRGPEVGAQHPQQVKTGLSWDSQLTMTLRLLLIINKA